MDRRTDRNKRDRVKNGKEGQIEIIKTQKNATEGKKGRQKTGKEDIQRQIQSKEIDRRGERQVKKRANNINGTVLASICVIRRLMRWFYNIFAQGAKKAKNRRNAIKDYAVPR